MAQRRDQLAELGFRNYAEYLDSPYWRGLKARLLRGRFCEVCQKKPARVPHHLNYWHLGHEKPSDFLLVCVDCHGTIHRELDHRYPREPIWRKVEQTVAMLHSLGHKVLDPARVPTPQEESSPLGKRRKRRRKRHLGANGWGHYEPGKRGKRYSYREAVERAGLTWQDTVIQRRPMRTALQVSIPTSLNSQTSQARAVSQAAASSSDKNTRAACPRGCNPVTIPT